jgi:hypothetical protein
MDRVEKGEDPRDLNTNYIFCKQIFAPWENLDDDPVAIDFIYEQILNGRHSSAMFSRVKSIVNMFYLLSSFEFLVDLRHS